MAHFNRRNFLLTSAHLASTSLLAGCAALLPPSSANMIRVRAARGAISGTLYFHDRQYPCMVGRTGIRADKHEGDGATPEGIFSLRQGYYRADRLSALMTNLPVSALTAQDSWCDDVSSPHYNRYLKLASADGSEHMWREDHLYDALAVIGYNDHPVVSGKGSGIFLHVTRPPTDDHQYTAGCVSLHLPDLLEVLKRCSTTTRIDIRAL